jgi:hypothetical protein
VSEQGVAIKTVLPVAVPAGFRVDGIVASMLPWHAPSVFGLVGAKDSQPALAVTMEWPTVWIRTAEPFEQYHQEWLLIRRFSADQAIASGGTHAYGRVEPGANPPDATVATSSGTLGLEATALTVEGRRTVHNLFLELRRRLQISEPAAFSKLIGHVVYIWFERPGVVGLGLPHKRSDNTALDAIVEDLAKYEPVVDLAPQAPPDVGETLELGFSKASADATFSAVPMLQAVPSTVLFTIAGFEIGLAYTTIVTREKAQKELQRLVEKHDKAGVDLLLITAGGPDASGIVFPAEEAFASFLIDHEIGLDTKPKHIKQVILHSWATGTATLLHPKFTNIFGPLYQSMAPVNHSIVGNDRSAAHGQENGEMRREDE